MMVRAETESSNPPCSSEGALRTCPTRLRTFIPAVGRVFATRFGDERLAEGDNFLSVAYGLALIGLENDVEPWLASPAAT